MAFVSNMDDDEQDPKAASQGVVAPVGGGGVHLAPSSGVGAAGQGSGSSTGPSNAGGSFATLQTYLGANQGQAPGLANAVTTNIGNQYNTLQDQNTSTLAGIQGQVNSGYTPENQGVLDQEAANPVSFVSSDPNNVSSFQGQLNDKYTGPTSAEGSAAYQNQSAAVNNAIATGQSQVGTEAGREQLLQANEAAPTAGVTALNSAILSQDPSAQSTIENAYQPFSNLTSQLSTGAGSIDNNIATDTAQARDASSKANASISKQSSDLQNGLTSGLSTADQNQTTYNNLINKDQAGANSANSALLADQQNDLALANNTNYQDNDTAAAAKQYAVSGVNSLLNPQLGALVPWLNSNLTQVNAPTLADTATSNQYATDSALSQLAGQNYSPQLDQSNVGQAGTFNIPTPPAALNLGAINGAGNEANDLSQVLNTAGSGGFRWYDPGQLGGNFASMNPQQLATQINKELNIQGPQETDDLAGNQGFMTSLMNLINQQYGA